MMMKDRDIVIEIIKVVWGTYSEGIIDKFADGLDGGWGEVERKRENRSQRRLQDFWPEHLEGWNYHQLKKVDCKWK